MLIYNLDDVQYDIFDTDNYFGENALCVKYKLISHNIVTNINSTIKYTRRLS